MTSAVELIQMFLTPTQVNEIVDWNKARNNLELNSDNEVEMLREEVVEYFDAEELVDRFDAVIDTLFVATGTQAKAAYAFHLIPENFFSPIDFVLTDFVGRIEASGIHPQFFAELLKEGMDIVVKANSAKGKDLDENGKVIKPADFVPPEELLAEVLDKYIAMSSQLAQQSTEQVMGMGGV